MKNNIIAGKSTSKRWGIFLLIPLLIFFITLCILGKKWESGLIVTRVVLEGVHILPEAQIHALANIPTNSILDTVDVYQIRNRMLQQPFIKSVKVNRQYPDAVSIKIVEREPIATVNAGQFRYIDEDKVLLPYSETAIKLDLPIISGIDGINGAKLGIPISNEEISEAIEMLQVALELDSSMFRFISEVNMNGGQDIIITSTDWGIPIIVGRGEIRRKLLMFQTFWSNFVKSENAERLRYIDLRFSDQVVVRWQSDEQQFKSVL
ncbi:MAG: FtsQ-type POTRA domain-containing protein [Bacteroidota bacterium]|nr:FtsQ-type POTRA domain-containing protein [Bacteroidota bacterium]